MKYSGLIGGQKNSTATLVNGLVAILLAILLPPVGIFFAKDALESARRSGADETVARYALWISIPLTAAGLSIATIGFITSVVAPVLSLR